MFSSTSWTDYTIVVLLLLAIYYLTIGIRFYLHKWKNLVGKAKDLLAPVHNEPYNGSENNREGESGLEPAKPAQDQNYSTTSDEAFQQVEHLMGRLKEAIEEAWRKEKSKEELFVDLRLILKEYLELKNPSFESSINELIISECERYGSTMLSEDEIGMLWNDA